MESIRKGRPKPLTPAFARKIRRANFLFVLFSVAAFVGTVEWLLHTCARQWTEDQARLCAAALQPGPDGDLTEAVDLLRSRYDRLIAVATLDVSGHLGPVYPRRLAHRRAALVALAHPTDAVAIDAPDGGEPIRVTSAVVPLNGSTSPAARQVLIILRSDDRRTDWGRAATVFTLLVSAAALYVTRSMRRWFDGRLASRLRSMARILDEPLDRSAPPPKLEPGEWRETVEIAERFYELLDGMAESDARVRRAEFQHTREISRREKGFDQALRRERDKATIDALTKLRNRAFLDEELQPLFERQKANGGDLSAVMIDLDNFKRYNDTFGHQIGDSLLRFVGALLRGAIRPADYAIRYGGDEFLLLLPDADARQSAAIAERLLKLFGQYTGRMCESEALSLTAGIASLNGDGAETGEELVAKADAVLYSAKRRGKNRVGGYMPPERSLRQPAGAAV